MNRETILEWLLYRGAAVVMIAIMSVILYFIFFSVPMYDLHSLYMHDEIIVYHTKAIAGAAGIPVYVYGIFLGLRVLVTKGIKPPTTQTAIGIILTPVIAFVTLSGFIIAFLIPIGLMFTPYHNCPQEKLGAFYVTDLKLCKNIDYKNWTLERHE
ncbi:MULTISPECIES: hypothetical protein [Buttiauxella]|uniref:hypothetical protein n=1 Tax=Buttiauxella TaxID=82976 RepID=UPI0015613894|nr:MULTISPECIES: hypothetical protein [Buttiauxella]MCS3604875.1 succinate dehydrogenase hydrophobic anchor subunit [Buttiauxella sp. BIGb0471]BCG11262.1 DUF1240 domain-containing protein [Buttiauxella agrestis]